MAVDLVLSSGFLAFAEQAGFLRAVEESGLEVAGVCGTSSGALAGSLWAAGMPAEDVLAELTRNTPLSQVALSRRPWRGLFQLAPVRAQLAENLPDRLEQIPRAVGVGTVGPDGRARLVTTGNAVDAVLASCAVPWLFAPIQLDDGWHSDGGALDRTALTAWRAHRPHAEVVLHLVDRSAGADSHDVLDDVVVCRSARSGARLWNLGDVRARYERSRIAALEALAPS